jgi:CheY-like chemotaxis protein
MTITRNLVQMMNGKLTVDSTPGAGSTFTIRIPQGVTDPKIIGKEAAKNLENFNFIGAGREKQAKIVRELMPYGKVLVVDDMKSNLDVAKLLMAPYQLQVDTAEKGIEAIEKIKRGSVYDLVFMDHMMPGMDGIETTKIIREEGYTNPIFVLTANAVAGQQEIFLASGFDGFISKPIDLRQLNNTLNKYIRNKNRDKTKETDLPSTVDTVTEDQDIPAIEIPGVNTEAALALYDGDRKMYVHILRSFVPNALDVIEKLRNVSEKTLPDYAINIHGLKGISAGIGAAELSNAAKNLETKAKSGDLAGILAENEKVIKDAENLVNTIQAWLKELDSGDSRPLLPCPDSDLLAHLLKCCEEYDMNGADKVMAELESANYESGTSLVAWLRERINESDFASVAARLGSS